MGRVEPSHVDAAGEDRIEGEEGCGRAEAGGVEGLDMRSPAGAGADRKVARIEPGKIDAAREAGEREEAGGQSRLRCRYVEQLDVRGAACRSDG